MDPGVEEDWDEQASWSAFFDDADDVNPADMTALVDRLGPAFTAQHHRGKEYIKHAFMPVLQHTKQLHAAIETDIFPRRARGLAMLDSANICYENVARRDVAATETAYVDARHSLDTLFTTLDDLDRQADVLFQTFRTSMHEHVQRLRRCADQMPADGERVISGLDRKAKHLGAEDHAKAKESLLRGILEKY